MEPRSRECLTPSQIEALLYSTVPAEDQLPDNAHLAACARCRKEFEEQWRFARLREEFATLPTSPHGTPPPQLPGYKVLGWLVPGKRNRSGTE